MEIIVCVKRVPATTARINIAQGGLALDPAGIEFVLNPYDEFAVEEALKQRDAAGEGSVTVLTFGAAESQKELRTWLAMGADAAILLQNERAPHADAIATAQVLADAIRDMEYDLVLFGKQAVDRDQHGVGPAVATLLGIPCITEIEHLDLADSKVSCQREAEGATETIEASLPCALTCQKGLNEPRYASLKGIMAAKKKSLDILETEAKEAKVNILAMTPPPQRPAGQVVGQGADAVPELLRLLQEESKVL